MPNKTLFLRELKANYKLLLIFAAVLTLYPVVIITMFDPKLGDSLNLMMESMPDLFAAFNMQNPGTTLLDFLINYLYGFLLLIFPMIFFIILANKLVARYVDRGSMVYLIASPHRRSRIVFTQGVFLAAASLVLAAYVTVLCILVCQAAFPGELDISGFVMVNLGLWGLHLFLAGLCFCFSCLFNDTRISTGLGAGCCIAFVLIQMLSQVGDKLDFLKYATPLTLFDPNRLAQSEPEAWMYTGILYAAGILFFGIGMGAFAKRDLTL